jgi:peptidoglycan/LPS O-acetylase OafA/YrhL
MTHIDSRVDISANLTWVDMLKGIAIIAVFFDNWIGYMTLAATPTAAHTLVKVFKLSIGSFVQVFFILSGFGLTVAYLKQKKATWSWQRWAWRRFTKIVIPYEIAVLLTFALGMFGPLLYKASDVQFSGKCLLAYMTLTRNFFSSCWGWNPPLWFMPIIIGLYLFFPILLRILEKWGASVLLLASFLITYGSLVIAALAGARGGHGSDLPTYWVVQFAFGMILAYARETNPKSLHLLLGPRAFAVGAGLTVCSWALRTYVPLGKVFNDSLTSLGIFLILLNLSLMMRSVIPTIGSTLTVLSSRSYLMYLIHYPIMVLLIGPGPTAPMNPVLVMVLGSVFILMMFVLCSFISMPLDYLTLRLYRRQGFG